jgi:hypothetical protein
VELPEQQYKNRVLVTLPKPGLDGLTPHLSPVTLPLHEQLLDGRADYAYFWNPGWHR